MIPNTFRRITSNSLHGYALDWAVAKAEDKKIRLTKWPVNGVYSVHSYLGGNAVNYSRFWTDAGPIIHRERISIDTLPDNGWRAFVRFPRDIICDSWENFPTTPIMLAMRVYVIKKLGEEVDIPIELL